MLGFRESFWVSPSERDRIERSGFSDYASFLRFDAGEVVSEVRDRIVFRVAPDEGGPRWFLKVYRRSGANRPFRQILHRRLPLALSEMEARNLEWLEREGFLAPRVLAWGGRLSGFFERDSFLLTEEMVGYLPFDEWLEARAGDEPEKRTRLEACGRLLRNLHDRGFHHPFPYLRHFFVPEGAPSSGEVPRVGVIDVDFAEIGNRVALARRSRGLAETLLSSYRSDLTQTDRLRFFRAYCGKGELDHNLFNRTWRRFRQKLRKHPNRFAWAIEKLDRTSFPPSLGRRRAE